MKKPWSISTTVRNPDRLRDFLGVLKELEGQAFNSENQIKYQILLIQNKFYKPTDLTKEQEELLIFLATSSNYVTQKDLAIQLKRAPSNISGYYFNPLRDAGVIEVKKQEGKLKYWGLTQDYLPIKFILKAKKTIQQKTEENMQQLALFT